MTKPFVKWTGGKRRSWPHIKKRIKLPFSIYHEPFVGGGAVFYEMEACRWLRDQPAPRAVLSDINEPLMRAYAAVKYLPARVVSECYKLQKEYARNDPKKAYLKMRDRFNREGATMAGPELAALFIFLNKRGFNGLYRVNKQGHFNVPWGQNEDPQFFSVDAIHASSKALKFVELHTRGFDAALEEVNSGDLVYFDPPYLPSPDQDGTFTAYDKKGFTFEDHVALRDIACELRSRGAQVLLSNFDTPTVRGLYEPEGWTVDTVPLKRTIGGKGSERRMVYEALIWSDYDWA